ncbi:MAG: twin-arginine translocation signal domain-containing protein [Candidatus Hydrogenedentes bacterium]|nr:twin-arginine translocation signal domain-containing protein [Candidatus Hydrogenedentota bacterium]
MDAKVTRRGFIRLSLTAAGAGLLFTGCPPTNLTKVVTVFMRSGRGRRISNAAKKHNNNHLYASAHAAQMDPAHPGDNSKVVSYFMSRENFNMLFTGGRGIVDLRRI